MTTEKTAGAEWLAPLAQLLEVFKKFRELVIALGVVVSALVFVRDYFATRIEVEVLRCQMDAGRMLIQARLDTEKISKELVDILDKLQNPDYSAQRNTLEVEKKSKEAEWQKMRGLVDHYAARLDQRICQKEVSP